MRNKILVSLLLLPIIGLCTQQYVISNGQTLQNQPQVQPSLFVKPGSINIYAPSHPQAIGQQIASYNNATQQPTNNPNPSRQENFYQPQKQDWWENKKVQPKAESQSGPQTQTQQEAVPAPPAVTSSNQTSGYNQQQEQLWQQSCLNSVTDAKVAPYAQKYCVCGWRHISSGELPIKYLTSNSASDIKAGNTILRVIKDECMAEVLASQGAPK